MKNLDGEKYQLKKNEEHGKSFKVIKLFETRVRVK